MSALKQKKCPQCGFVTTNSQFVFCPCCESDKVKLIDIIDAPSYARNIDKKSDHIETSDIDKNQTGMINKDTGASVGMGGINTGVITSTTTINNNNIQKTPAEILVESRKTYRDRCKDLFKDGFITDDGLKELEEIRCSINLDVIIAQAIRDEVKALSVKVITELPEALKIKLEIFHKAISQNNTEGISSIIPELEKWMKRVRSSELSSIYYQLNAILYPEKYKKILLENNTEDYWKTYWSYIAYSLQGLNAEAGSALAELTAWNSFYPQKNQVLLLAIGYLMNNDVLSARLAYSTLSTGVSNELTSIKSAISELMGTDYTNKNIVNLSGNTLFYAHNLFTEFFKEIESKLKENKAKQIEDEAAEQRRLNKIRYQKESVLQKFQETCQIEKACQEFGVAYHTFNVWLKEDSTFASSYNELVHCMEVRKYEEAEKERIEQELQAEIKRKKSQFKTLFEQNKCDLLKTCSEVGISSADYQEWLSNDRTFRDHIKYIQTKHDVEQKQISSAKMRVKIKAFLRIAIIVLVVGVLVGTIAYITWRSHEKEEQAKLEEQNIRNKRDSLAMVININLNKIKCDKDSLSDEEFEALLNENSVTLSELESFESRNSVLLNNDLKYKKTDSIITAEYMRLLNAFNQKTNASFGKDEKNNGNKIDLLNDRISEK